MKVGKKAIMWLLALTMLLQGSMVTMATDRAGEADEVAMENDTTESETTIMHRTAVTVVDDANFHKGPGTNYEQISQLPANTNVRISGRRGNWYQIVSSGTSGWISMDDVAQTYQTAVVLENHVPVRSARSTSADILTEATRGTRVTVTRRTAKWSQVTVNHETGWISNNQLDMTTGRHPGHLRDEAMLYTKPDESSMISRRMPPNQEFMILQSIVDGSDINQGFTQVEIRHDDGTQTGWVRTNQVESHAQERRIRGGGRITIRTGPGTQFARISTGRRILRNTEVTILAESENWSHIRFDHNEQTHYGWILSRRLTNIKRLPQRDQIALGTTLLGSITLVSGLAIVKKRKKLMIAPNS